MAGTWDYRAAEAEGRILTGSLPASSADDAILRLRASGLLPLSVERSSESADPGRRATRGEVLEFTRGLAALVLAGMPLERALLTAADSLGERRRALFSRVREEVRAGRSLADALPTDAPAFTPFYRGMVRAGERTGRLGQSLDRLAQHLEREAELRARLLSMSLYPALLAVVGVAASALLVLFVLPRFSGLMAEVGGTLPPATRILVFAGASVRAHTATIATALVVGVGLILLPILSGSLRNRLLPHLHRLPLFGVLHREVHGARLARLLGALLSSGTPLLAALRDASGCLADGEWTKAVDAVAGKVREGVRLSRAMEQSPVFPPLLIRMAEVGDEAGDLPGFLLRCAGILERRSERVLGRVMSLIEPGVILLFGGLVGFVALALLQGVYGLNAGALP